MKSIEFIKEPGYMYDLLYIFSLYYNFDAHIEEDIPEYCTEEGIEYLQKIKDHFSPISDDLALFFYKGESGKEFLSIYCYHDCIEEFLSGYNFDYVLKKLSDMDNLTINLLQYYFPNVQRSEIEKKKNSMSEMSRLIDSSRYPEMIKRRLYSYLADPEKTLLLLTSELIYKNNALNEYYEKNYKSVVDVYGTLTPDQAMINLRGFIDDKLLDDETEVLPVSVCALNKNCVRLTTYNNFVLLTLGIEYLDGIKQCKKINEELPSLYEFGNALAEANRIDILDMLIEKGEVTMKDLERSLSFSGSTAYYHINLMLDVGLISTRNEGRTILYSLNRKKFDSVIELIKKYTTKG